eukprot:gene53330-21269_t
MPCPDAIQSQSAGTGSDSAPVPKKHLTADRLGCKMA